MTKEMQVEITETGEIFSAITTIKIKTLDEYLSIYVLNIQEALNLENQHLKILIQCWKYSTYSEKGNKVINNQLLKNKIRESGLKVSDTVINNAFTEFVKHNLMFKECRGNYILNPQHFFTGSISNRSQFKLIIEK